jgi:hypothetical protein
MLAGWNRKTLSRSSSSIFPEDRLPDLVEDSKLHTEFRKGLTVHLLHELSRAKSKRPVRKEQCWKREKQIGFGGFGRIWLESSTLGEDKRELRAVKELEVPSHEKAKTTRAVRMYLRELEAIAKFSQRKVSFSAFFMDPNDG